MPNRFNPIVFLDIFMQLDFLLFHMPVLLCYEVLLAYQQELDRNCLDWGQIGQLSRSALCALELTAAES